MESPILTIVKRVTTCNYSSKKEWRLVLGRETATIDRAKAYVIEIAATSYI
jgi:hypothetical protein